MEAAWEVIFADHSPTDNMFISVIVCDLFCAHAAAQNHNAQDNAHATQSSSAQGSMQHHIRSCFFDLCFGFPLAISPKTSKVCSFFEIILFLLSF